MVSLAVLPVYSGGDRTPYPMPRLPFFPGMPYTDNPPTVAGARLGRFLFYDSMLSADGSFSCASCHRQEAAFSDGPRRFSVGLYGDTMARNTMPLFNLAWYPALFWDGRAASLEEQVFHPVRAREEMNLAWSEAARRVRASAFYRPLFRAAFGDVRVDSLSIARAIAQFERTLISCNARYDRVFRGEAWFTAEEYRGFVLMNDQTRGDCLHCHTTDADALGTTARFGNNGLDAVADDAPFPDPGMGAVTGRAGDEGRFRIPSLRNLAFTAPYMHDGRFATLDEVISFYSDGVHPSRTLDAKMQYARRGSMKLTGYERSCIKAFLLTLSDSSFVADPAFGNPFPAGQGR